MTLKTCVTFKWVALFNLLLFVVSVALFCLYHNTGSIRMQTAFVIALILFYHFFMRLAVGEITHQICQNREFNQNSFVFKLHSFEPKLYRKLKVKNLKNHLITARPELFDFKHNTYTQLLHNMMQAELVHKITMLLSFLPLLLIMPYGRPWLFIISSIAAAVIELPFIIIQRFNRPRVNRLIKKQNSATMS